MGHGEPRTSPSADATRSGLLRWPGAELDLRLAQVRLGGQVLALDRSSYEVLLALLLRAGQVLSKDDLLEAAWPGRVVSENSLAKAISRLRRELGDAAAAPLQSVHGYGYRWAGEVHWQDSERAVPAEAAPESDGLRWVGQPVAMRPGWSYRRVLGRGEHHLALLAESSDGDAPRALKVGLGEEGLHHVRREVALHRHLAALGTAPAGLAPALGWQLEQVPVFVEYPYFEEGDLWRWMGLRAATTSLETRLALVAQVADTLGDLHAAGVVHQGLSPGNVFLSADPERPEGWRIALTDLGGGYASVLPHRDATADDADAVYAESPGRDVGAELPIYAAPEAVAGAFPNQRSDLYALGVLLYQMVLGDLRRPLAPGWEHDVEDPLLREDIAALTARRPEDRNLGAHALAERLRTLPQRRSERLEAEQALAQRQEVEVQLQRQRRRLRLLGVAAAALCVGLAVAGWSGWLAIEARAEEQRRHQEAQAVLGFLTRDLLTRADPYQGGQRDVSLRSALDAAAARIDERLGASPQTAAAVHEAIAGAYEGWGDFARAAEHRQHALSLATESGEAPLPSLAERQRQICDLQRQAGALEAALAACEAAMEADRLRDGAVSAASIIVMAKLDEERGRCLATVEALQPVVDAGSSAAGASTALIAEAHWFLGRCQSRLAEDAAAIEALRVAVHLVEAEWGEEHPNTGWALGDYAEALTRAGRFEEASAAIERMSRVFLSRFGPDYPDAQLVPFRRAEIAAAQGRNADAARLFGEAAEGWARTLGPGHPLGLMARSRQALALARDGQRDAAAVRLAEVRLDAPQVIAQRGSRAADFHEVWAETLLRLGRAEEAEAEIAAFQQASGDTLPAGHPRVAAIHCLASWTASLDGEIEQAGTLLTDCRIGLARFSPTDHRRATLAGAERAMTAFDGRP